MAKLILASQSPRRQELLKEMGLDFQVLTIKVDESFPPELTPSEAVQYIARKKAEALTDYADQDLVLTADTIVVLDGRILGKPKDEKDALEMLSSLSGRWHEVMTACCLLYRGKFSTILEVTRVCFRELSRKELEHYIQEYQPFDKAGAYGIQEWIGIVGVTEIQGSYHNVVGLPTTRLYEALKELGPKGTRTKD